MIVEITTPAGTCIKEFWDPEDFVRWFAKTNSTTEDSQLLELIYPTLDGSVVTFDDYVFHVLSRYGLSNLGMGTDLIPDAKRGASRTKKASKGFSQEPTTNPALGKLKQISGIEFVYSSTIRSKY